MHGNLDGRSRIVVLQNLRIFGSTQFAGRNFDHILRIDVLFARETTQQNDERQENQRQKEECDTKIGFFVFDVNRVSGPTNNLVRTTRGYSAPMTFRGKDSGIPDPHGDDLLLNSCI